MSDPSSPLYREQVVAELRRKALWRRGLYFACVILSTLAGSYLMADVLRANGFTGIEMAILVLFTISFAWICTSFWTATIGFLVRLAGRDPAGLDPNKPVVLTARTAIIMPVYNEDPTRVFAGLEATWRSLQRTGEENERTFDLFILSDTRKPEIAEAEEAAWAALCNRLNAEGRIFYRRRESNIGRKAGNIADFLRQWGLAYDHMLVLDADSIMTGATIRELSARMNADPRLALIQTMPILVGGETIFARLTQFAGRVYGPMIARGVSAWSGDTGNFWGHNAIIRLPAFARSCGLPRLPGRPPFGGTILSHDFVEAAALCRAGWKVRLDHDLRGSFEGCPPTLLDMAVRERRWAQGNLQHSRLFGMRGARAVTLAHFTIGILGFLMSPLWLALILVGLVLSATVLLSTPEYFPNAYQLFPDWPVFDSRRMLWLFVVSMALLLLPKLIATFRAWLRPLARNSGGPVRIFASSLFEILLSTLIAPVQMLIQTRQIYEILRGRDSGWNAQVRAGSMPDWNVVISRHWGHVLLGIGTLIVLAQFSPAQLIWLSPILAGLILSPVTSRYSASPVFGRWARMRGLLVTPEERDPPAILSDASAVVRSMPRPLKGATDLLRFGGQPDRIDRHIALLPDDPALPEDKRLHRITAGAKITHAGSRTQALDYLTRDETDALVSDPALLRQWSVLPS